MPRAAEIVLHALDLEVIGEHAAGSKPVMQRERHVSDVSGRKAPRRGITDSSASASPTRYAPPSPRKVRPLGKLTSTPATLAASTHAAENTTGSPAIHPTSPTPAAASRPSNPER